MRYYKLKGFISEEVFNEIKKISGTKRVALDYVIDFLDEDLNHITTEDLAVDNRLLCIKSDNRHITKYVHYPVERVTSDVYILDNDLEYSNMSYFSIKDILSYNADDISVFFVRWDNISEEMKTFLTIKYNIKSVEEYKS